MPPFTKTAPSDFGLRFQSLSYVFQNTKFLPVCETVNQGFENSYLFRQRVALYGPFTWVEQTIGIGFEIPLKGGLCYIQKAGAGINLILGRGNGRPMDIVLKRFAEWEMAYLFQFGIKYQFKSKPGL